MLTVSEQTDDCSNITDMLDMFTKKLFWVLVTVTALVGSEKSGLRSLYAYVDRSAQRISTDAQKSTVCVLIPKAIYPAIVIGLQLF